MNDDNLEGLSPLWQIILSAGSIAKPMIFVDETLGKKNPAATPEFRELVEKTRLKENTENRATWFFAHVRGLHEFLGDLDDPENRESARFRCNAIWTFLEITEGAVLCRSIRVAESLGRLEELCKDMESTGFARALLNYSDAFDGKINKNAFLLLAEDIDDDMWNVINYTVSPMTREQLELIHKRKNNSKRNASRKADKEPSTADILKRFWLPLSLWRMTAGEILDTITMLKSGGTADDFERDCKKVEKAVRELGLCRYELEPNV